MTLSRVTRCALLLVPLFVCAGRLHAQHGAAPGVLQEVNRCLSVVRATSKRRQQQERTVKQREHATPAQASVAAYSS